MFDLNTDQIEKLNEWIKQQEQKIIKEQTEFLIEEGAYYGAIGGGYTYCYTPTSLGTIVKVHNNVTKEEIDLTDYYSW